MKWRSLVICAFLSMLLYWNDISLHWPNAYGRAYIQLAAAFLIGSRAMTLVVRLRIHRHRHPESGS